MADPLDALGGGGADPWQNLMAFGLATMAAGSQPGAQTLGAIGQGGLAAMQQSRENASAAAQSNYVKSQTQSNQLNNQLALQKINYGRKMTGMPLLDSSGNPINVAQPPIIDQNSAAAAPVSTTASNDPSSAAPNSSGMSYAPTAGSSARTPATYTSPTSSGPTPAGTPYTPDQISSLIQGAYNGTTPWTPGTAQIIAPTMMQMGDPNGEYFAKLASAGPVAAATKQAEAPFEFHDLRQGGSLFQGSNLIGLGNMPAVSPNGTQYMMPAHPVAQGTDPTAISAIYGNESNYGQNPGTSTAGASGPMQLMPGTAQHPGYGVTPAKDNSPEENARVGTDYFNAMSQKYQGNQTLAAMAYNWGPDHVDNWLKNGANPSAVPPETQKYVMSYAMRQGAAAMTGNAPMPPGATPPTPPGTTPTMPNASQLPPGAIQTGIGPAQEGFLKTRGDQLATKQGEWDESAQHAIQNNFLLDQMKQDSQNFTMGWGTDREQAAKKILQGFATKMGADTTPFDAALGSGQAFDKSAGQLTREAVRETSSKAAFQEFQMIQNQLPSKDMSRSGFENITNQMGAVNDYTIARQTAAQQYMQTHQTLDGFETDFNKNVSPAVFLVHRMDAPTLQGMRDNLMKQPNGQQVINGLMQKVQYANQNGLFE